LEEEERHFFGALLRFCLEDEEECFSMVILLVFVSSFVFDECNSIKQQFNPT